ncbi:unnamed protein product, partial [Urochloa humidicola]
IYARGRRRSGLRRRKGGANRGGGGVVLIDGCGAMACGHRGGAGAGDAEPMAPGRGAEGAAEESVLAYYSKLFPGVVHAAEVQQLPPERRTLPCRQRLSPPYAPPASPSANDLVRADTP